MLSRVAVLLFVCAAPAIGAELIDRILAVVNGSIITLSDVHAAEQFGLVSGAGNRAAAIERLIDRRLMLMEVDRYAPAEPKAEQIDAGIAAIQARFASPAAFQATLAASGLTMEQLRRHKRDDLRLETYLQQRFALAVQPSDDEVLAYYRANQSAFTRGGVLRSYEEARADARAALMAQRRRAAEAEWIAGLRRRADISVLPLR